MSKRFFLFCLVLCSCGTAVTDRTKAVKEPDASSPFSVTEFSPAGGSVAELPPTVTIYFNEIPLRRTLAAVTYYSLNCGNGLQHASSVDAISGYSSVTVTLPTVTGLAPGTSCTLGLAPNLLDQNGNPLSGPRTVTYIVTQ